MNQDYGKIEFKDNGIGISDHRKDLIFQKGMRKYKGEKGMGIGLSLVKMIIDGFDGKIWIQDRIEGDYSKGSNFCLLLKKADK